MALDSNIKNQLKAYMEKLVNPIVIAASTDGA
jgi:alkyl hydroperoxide reductase subunit AhpF